MNHSQHSTRVRKSRSSSLMVAAVVSTALLALCVADANAARSGGGRAGGQMAQSSVSSANRSMSGASTANVNRGNVNTGNINTGNINTGNVNIGNDVNINIDGGYGYHGGYYGRPIAAGAVIGAVAVTTAAVVGSYYYALPPTGCSVVYRAGVSYHYCGSVYYQQTFSGDKVVYVVVTP